MKRAVMKTKTDNTLKQALEKRNSGRLSSNFTFRMMEQIRIEAAKQERRRKRNLLFSLLTALAVLLGTLVYFLFFYLGLKPSELMPHWELSSTSSPLIAFYAYIALLALGLLGMDYWVRRKRSIYK